MEINKKVNNNIIEETEIELAEDLKDLIKFNPDVKASDDIKEKIKKFDDDNLIKVTKECGSLIIKDVEHVTEELLKKDL